MVRNKRRDQELLEEDGAHKNERAGQCFRAFVPNEAPLVSNPDANIVAWSASQKKHGAGSVGHGRQDSWTASATRKKK